MFYTTYPVYPTAVLNTTDYPDQVDDVDWVYDHLVNALRDEVIALQGELGTLPKGGYATVKARLDDIAGGTIFTHRGDPAAWDYGLGDLTNDSAWHDLDLSGIISAGALAAVIWVSVNSPVVGNYVALRKNGLVNAYTYSLVRTQVANVINSLDCVVGLDSNRKIEYNLGLDVTSTITIQINGWWG